MAKTVKKPAPARFTKIGAKGKKLPASATTWVAVLDNTTGLMWDVAESARMTWAKAAEYAKKLKSGGLRGWRLPTVEELFLLADRSKHSPAIDTAFFPNCKSEWYWTGTPAAYSPSDYAWYVDFYYGYSSWDVQSGELYVRAVRSSQ